MALTEKQRKVIDFALSNGGIISKQQAMELINDYYHNGAKHVGDVLSRMVNSGLLVRIKPGLFKTGTPKKTYQCFVSPDQTDLFNG